VTRAYIGLGSNLDHPREQLRRAIAELGQLPQTALVNCSPLYASKPVGPQDQPDYVNAVAELETQLAPLALLDELQAIERAHGRRRDGPRWGPRTLDLDILLYGDWIIREQRLVVPHPELAHRAFVLKPLYDIAPEAGVPGAGLVAELLRRVDLSGVWRLEEDD
jgi:2-amino-4-hydroxy-6-hydroxymethyldihydropteridine diphosphokinase